MEACSPSRLLSSPCFIIFSSLWLLQRIELLLVWCSRWSFFLYWELISGIFCLNCSFCTLVGLKTWCSEHVIFFGHWVSKPRSCVQRTSDLMRQRPLPILEADGARCSLPGLLCFQGMDMAHDPYSAGFNLATPDFALEASDPKKQVPCRIHCGEGGCGGVCCRGCSVYAQQPGPWHPYWISSVRDCGRCFWLCDSHTWCCRPFGGYVSCLIPF